MLSKKVNNFLRLLCLMFLCFSCDKTNGYNLRKIGKNERDTIINCYEFIYRNRTLSSKDLKVLEKISKDNYLLSSDKLKYVPRVKYSSSRRIASGVDMGSSYIKFFRYVPGIGVLFISSFLDLSIKRNLTLEDYYKERKSTKTLEKNCLYIKNIITKEVKLLKNFSISIRDFSFDLKENKIVINFYKNIFNLYAFPNFKLLKEIKGEKPKFDVITGKLYYTKTVMKKKKGKKSSERISSLYTLKDNKESLLYKGEDYFSSVSNYYILNSSDILISSPTHLSFWEIMDGKKYKSKYFLLSNPEETLLEK